MIEPNKIEMFDWSQVSDEHLEALYVRHKTWKGVASALGVTESQLRQARYRRRRQQPEKSLKERGLIQVGVPRDWIPMLGRKLTGEPGWIDYFYDAQRGFTFDDHFISFFLGGNGTGKTRVGSYNVLAQMMGVHPRQIAQPPLRCRVVVPSFEDGVKKIFLPKLYEPQVMADGSVMAPMMPKSFVTKNFDDKNRRIALANGSYCEFMTHDQSVLQHAGAELDLIDFDEEPPKKLWNENKARLRNAHGGGKIYLTMTPPFDPTAEPPWTGEELYERRPSNVGVFRAAMADNPAITAAFIEDFTEGMTDEEIQVRVFGNYPMFGRVIYPYYVDRYIDDPDRPGNLIRAFNIPEHWAPRTGLVDYHAAKPTAILWAVVAGDTHGPITRGDVIFYMEAGGKETEDQTIRVLADIIRKKEAGRQADWRLFDPSGHHRQQGKETGWSPIEEFGRNGISGGDANTAWDTGWSVVNQYFAAAHRVDTVSDRDPASGRMRKHPKALVFDTLRLTRWSLLHHVWAVRGQKREPHQKGKDFCDLIRYMLVERPKSYNRVDPWSTREDWLPPRPHTAGLYGRDPGYSSAIV